MVGSEPVYQLIYVSVAVEAMEEAELAEILKKARENNHSLGITGVLLYAKGNFLQILEGPQAKVEALYERIRKDDRHVGVIVVYRCSAARREFADWSMGYTRLTDAQAEQVGEGFSRLLEHSKEDDQAMGLSARVRQMLSGFRLATTDKHPFAA